MPYVFTHDQAKANSRAVAAAGEAGESPPLPLVPNIVLIRSFVDEIHKGEQ